MSQQTRTTLRKQVSTNANFSSWITNIHPQLSFPWWVQRKYSLMPNNRIQASSENPMDCHWVNWLAEGMRVNRKSLAILLLRSCWEKMTSQLLIRGRLWVTLTWRSWGCIMTQWWSRSRRRETWVEMMELNSLLWVLHQNPLWGWRTRIVLTLINSVGNLLTRYR